MTIIIKTTFTFKSHASIIQKIVIISLTSNLSPFERLLKSKTVQILTIKVIYNQRSIEYSIQCMSAKHNCHAPGVRINSTDSAWQPVLERCFHISTTTLKLLNKLSLQRTSLLMKLPCRLNMQNVRLFSFCTCCAVKTLDLTKQSNAEENHTETSPRSSENRCYQKGRKDQMQARV